MKPYDRLSLLDFHLFKHHWPSSLVCLPFRDWLFDFVIYQINYLIPIWMAQFPDFLSYNSWVTSSSPPRLSSSLTVPWIAMASTVVLLPWPKAQAQLAAPALKPWTHNPLTTASYSQSPTQLSQDTDWDLQSLNPLCPPVSPILFLL